MRLLPLNLAWMVALLAAGAVGCQPRSSMTSAPPAVKTPHHTNALAREKSPYLLQHKHNPVDWMPWGDAAFAKARAEKKPIFLSIGYSTCHWCHVMERETFENEDVARFLNQHYVSIKVDREERPDVDKIYMTYVQAITGQGGWPLTVFLTPELKPFYGGTYFPPQPRYGRPSFMQLITQIHERWHDSAADLIAHATEFQTRFEQSAQLEPSGEPLHPSLLRNAAGAFKREYDPRHGGFGSAPKFPRPSQPSLLLQLGAAQNDAEAMRMVHHTCQKMAAGGMYDQLGGGFARYSVDAQWLVPHFEKMLYDNAQLVHLYLDSHLAGGGVEPAAVAADILRYLLRDMTHPDGGFYSAEDADSEGKEGKFYCWTLDEVKALLDPAELEVAVDYFGITAKGNFEDHSDPEPLKGQNVLSVIRPELAKPHATLLASAKQKLFQARARRVRPHLDDKILASWNGLMLGAVARAGVILDDPALLAAAEKNLAFLKARLWDNTTGTLYHRWRDGERDTVQLLDAYAFLLSGVIELYQATLNPGHLEFSVQLADAMIRRFHDPKNGGFWQSAADSSDLILRLKDDYDGAEPAGNSVATLSLLKLAAITDRKDYLAAAEGTLRLLSSRMQRQPQGVPLLLSALHFWLEPPRRVVITGDANDTARASLLRAAHRVYLPNRVILGTEGPVEETARTLRTKSTRAEAYVCTGAVCLPPVETATELARVLGGKN